MGLAKRTGGGAQTDGTIIMSMFHTLTRWIFLLLLLALSSCRSTHDMSSVPTNSTAVEIEMTSGMPSPKWLLSPAEVAAMEQTLRTLPATDSASLFDGLGYRGFVIRLNAPERLIRVQNGYVVVEEGGLQKSYVDADHQLEQWLLDASKAHIEPALFSSLAEEIGK